MKRSVTRLEEMLIPSI